MSQVQMNTSNLGGTIDGNFGTYQPDSNGFFNADSRDAAALLAAGCTYVRKASSSYTASAPLVATAGQIHASGALSNSTLTISNQPDVMRQVSGVALAGTSAITAGNLAATYLASDGSTQVDNLPLATPASGTISFNLSKGVQHITSLIVTALAGGASPTVRLDTTAYLALPSDPGAGSFTIGDERVDGTSETATLSTTSLGCVAPGTAPNGTHNFSFVYGFDSPLV